MTKTMLNEVVEQLPEEFSIRELVEQLEFFESIERGRQQYREGKTLPHAEVKKRFQEGWPK